MVMIANKKSSDQMKDDLSLFIGDNVGEFVDWLHYCLDEIKIGNDPFQQRREETPKKSNMTKDVDQIVNNVSNIKKTTISSMIGNDNNSNNNQQQTNKIVKLNEDCKENAKDKLLVRNSASTRKAIITFNANEVEESNKMETKSHMSISSNSESTEESKNRSQHKRIVYNLDNNVDKNNANSPPKNPRNQITYHQQDLRSTLSSRSQSSNDSSNRRSFQINNFNRAPFNKSPLSHHHHNRSNQQLQTNQTTVMETDDGHVDNQEPIQMNQQPSSAAKPVAKNSIIFKAIAEANKSSTLDSVLLRKDKTSSSSSSPKTSLINRLGLGSRMVSDANANDANVVKNNEIKKENRLVNSKIISEYLNKSSTLERRKRLPDVKLDEVRQTDNFRHSKVEQLEIKQQNLDKEDLRHRLSSKRKKDESEDRQLSIKRKILNNNQNKNENDKEEKELRILNDNMKPKSKIEQQGNFKPKSSIIIKDKEVNDMKMDTDSDENVNVIIKRELLEKIRTMEQTAMNAQKIQQQQKISSSINKEISSQIVTIKKERCYFWPVCNNQDKCQFHHPKTKCM